MLNNNLYAEGGMNQQGGTTDPVSGNEVPAGALQKEVRDDIPAKLSEGEFVIPADVVRYIGLDRLMQLRDKAKEGLARMEEIGQMGNAEQATSPEEPHGDKFASEIDSIMSELDSEGEKNQLAGGGMPTTNAGFQVKQFKKPDGSSMFVTYINGVPATQIPEGAQEITAANQAQKDQASLTPTEKSVSNKSNMGTMAQVLTNTPDESRKMLNKAMMDKALEIKATRETKDAINKNIEFDPNAFNKTADSELANYSEAADYRLTDGMENYMLSNSMDQAASPSSTSLDTMPDMSGIATEMPMVMAKGGLVARRKK